MAINKRMNGVRRETYFVGGNADNPKRGHIWLDDTTAAAWTIWVWDGVSAWQTPRLSSPTLTGTTTVTTLNATTLTVASALTADTFRASGVSSLNSATVAGNTTVGSVLSADTVRVTGVASLAATNVNGGLTVASALATDTFRAGGVASLSNANINGTLTAVTQAASATGYVRLGTGAVPTAATSTSGILQVSALPGTPVGQSAVPATNTVFVTFDTTRRALAVNIAGSWFSMASMELY